MTISPARVIRHHNGFFRLVFFAGAFFSAGPLECEVPDGAVGGGGLAGPTPPAAAADFRNRGRRGRFRSRDFRFSRRTAVVSSLVLSEGSVVEGAAWLCAASTGESWTVVSSPLPWDRESTRLD